MAGLPSGHRRRLVRDGRDRQDRRAVLLLPRDPAAAQLHSVLAARCGHRGRPDQHRPRRLRREGDGLPRAPAGPGRARVPPHRSRADDCRADDQRVREGGQGAAVRVQPRHEADRVGARSGAEADPRGRSAAAGREAGGRPVAGRARHPARGAALRQLPDQVRLDQDAGSARRLGHRGAAAGQLRADVVGVLGAHVQPRPSQGPRPGPRHQGQDRDDHRSVVGHRSRDRVAGRRCRRQGHPRRARAPTSSSRRGSRSRTSAASPSCTAATCPT